MKHESYTDRNLVLRRVFRSPPAIIHLLRQTCTPFRACLRPSIPKISQKSRYHMNFQPLTQGCRSDPLPPWIPEIPPPGFFVDFTYISRTRDLDKFSVWLSIVTTMAKAAINNWNQVLPALVIFPEYRSVEVHVVSSANPPSYQTKSLTWTLQAAFEEYIERGQYSSASLTTSVMGRPLGSVSFRSTLPNSHQAINPLPQLAPRRRGLTIRLEYARNGAIFTDQGFFYTIMTMLTYAANGDPKTRPMAGINLYNSEEDYSISIEPMSPDATEELPLIMVIRILGGLPDVMYGQRTGGRWAELRGLVKWDGVNIGRVMIRKGQHGGEGCLSSAMLQRGRGPWGGST